MQRNHTAQERERSFSKPASVLISLGIVLPLVMHIRTTSRLRNLALETHACPEVTTALAITSVVSHSQWPIHARLILSSAILPTGSLVLCGWHSLASRRRREREIIADQESAATTVPLLHMGLHVDYSTAYSLSWHESYRIELLYDAL
jgi:hypothetical protein